MEREAIFRQWLATGVVALMGPKMPVKRIQAWSDRQLLDHFDTPNPGKNQPRMYSFVNAVQLHGMNIAASGGMTVKIATKIGKVCVKRFLDRFDSGDREFLGTTWNVLVCWVDGDVLRYRFMTAEDIATAVQENGMPTDPRDPGRAEPVHMLSADGLIDALWRAYESVTPEFNRAALEGRLKPFPKVLR